MRVKFCNVCGNRFNEWDEQEGFGIFHHIGYGSRYDGSRISLDMCCDCFDNLIDYIVPQCKFNPIEEDNLC